MTSSAGICGLIAAGSPPSATIASRIAARSTIAGTPVKSWRRTRAGRKEISWLGSACASQPATARTSSSLPRPSASARRTFSSRTRSVYGQPRDVGLAGERVEPRDACDRPPASICPSAPKLSAMPPILDAGFPHEA